MNKKDIKKYQIGADGLMIPRMASIKTAEVPLVSGIPKQVSISKYKPSFGDKARDFFSNPDLGGIASSVGNTLAMLINANKKDPNPGRPYKKGSKMINSKKSKLIKYQEGNEFLQSGKGIKNFLNTMEENNIRLSNASVKKEPVEKFDMSSIADIMPDIPQRFPKGSKAPDDTQVGPSRKEMADLLRAYNKKENAAGRLGYIDMEDADRMYEQNEAMMGNKINRVPGKIETLSPKMASIPTAQIPKMFPKMSPNVAPVQKQSRRERKAENERLFKMVRKDESPIEPLMPKMARLSPEIPAMQPSPKKVEVETPSKKIKYFDYTTKEAKGGYSRALKSGIKTKEGWLTDPETGLVYKDLRDQKGKNTTSKPLVKMKEDSWTPQQWKEFSDNRKKEMSLVNKEETYRKNPDLFWKDVQALRKSTMGKNFDRRQTSNNVVESPKKFSMNDIMLKKKELSELRSKVPGFGPFRKSEDAKTVEKIDYINSQLYKLSQQESAYERRKKRGEANKQAEIEAQERAKEFNRLTKDLKI